MGRADVILWDAEDGRISNTRNVAIDTDERRMIGMMVFFIFSCN